MVVINRIATFFQVSFLLPVPDIGDEVLEDPEDEVAGGDDGEGDEPEPEEDVDLLVEDVHAEDAEGVEPLDGSGPAILVEDALGHLGKDPRHRIDTVLRLHVHEAQHLKFTHGKHETPM